MQKGKRLPQWGRDETKKIISSVNNIISWGDGAINDYDPYMIGKVSSSLSYVDDLAHWVSNDDLSLKYNSIPQDVQEGLHQSAYEVSDSGITWIDLIKEAKNRNLKLSSDEISKLEKYPWVQKKYLKIKTSSKTVSTENMELAIEKIVEDFDNWIIMNKWNLTTRLQNILRDVSASDLEFTVNNIWDSLNKWATQQRRKWDIMENNKELNGYEDRTRQEKNYEVSASGLDAIANGVLNVFKFIGNLWVGIVPKSDVLAWLWGYDSADKMAEDYLLNVNVNNLSPATRIDVENARDAIRGKEFLDAWATYKQVRKEEFNQSIDEKKDAYTKAYPRDINKNLEQKEASPYSGFWNFMWNTIDLIVWTHLASEMFTTLVGDIFGTSAKWTEAVQQFLETAQKTKAWRMAQSGIKWWNALVEWGAFSAIENWEMDTWDILWYMFISKFFDWAWGGLTKLAEETSLKSIIWKKGLEQAVGRLTKQWYSTKDAIHALTDLFVKFGERWGKENMKLITKDALDSLWEWLKETLSKVNVDSEMPMIIKMAKYLMWKWDKGMEGRSAEWTLSALRNKLVTVEKWGERVWEDIVNEMYSIIERVANGKIKTLYDAFAVRQAFWRMSNAWNAQWVVKTPETSQIINDWFMSSLKTIDDVFKKSWGALSENLAKKWFGGIQDILNVEDILQTVAGWLEKNPLAWFWDRFMHTWAKFLGWGLISETAKGAGSEWALTSPYVATSLMSSILAMVTSPKVASRMLRLVGRTSMADRYSLIDWIMTSKSKEVAQDSIRTWLEHTFGDLGAEFVSSLINEIFSSDSGEQEYESYLEDWEDVGGYLDRRRNELINGWGREF